MVGRSSTLVHLSSFGALLTTCPMHEGDDDYIGSLDVQGRPVAMLRTAYIDSTNSSSQEIRTSRPKRHVHDVRMQRRHSPLCRLKPLAFRNPRGGKVERIQYTSKPPTSGWLRSICSWIFCAFLFDASIANVSAKMMRIVEYQTNYSRWSHTYWPHKEHNLKHCESHPPGKAKAHNSNPYSHSCSSQP